jgi:DNA polymerase III subunit beta
MNFTINRNLLLDNLSRVIGSINDKSSISSLSCFKFEFNISTEKLIITATDMELTTQSIIEIPANLVVSDSAILLIPAKKLFEFVKCFPENCSTTGEVIENRLHLSSKDEGIHIKFSLNLMENKDFPEIDESDYKNKFNFDGKELKLMLTKTLYACTKDENRYVLSGIYFEHKNDAFHFVATDGRRLSFIELSYPCEDFNIIIPSKTVNQLLKLIDISANIEINIGENKAKFIIGDTILITNLIEGTFPNYEQVKPDITKSKHCLKIVNQRLLNSINHIIPAIDMKTCQIVMLFKENSIEITGNTQETVEAIDYFNYSEASKTNKPLIQIALNYKFMLDILNNKDDTLIEIYMNEPNSPMLIKGENNVGNWDVIMPMKIDRPIKIENILSEKEIDEVIENDAELKENLEKTKIKKVKKNDKIIEKIDDEVVDF